MLRGTVTSAMSGANRVSRNHQAAESPLAVHGFAARDGVAGRAARQQIIAFMMSLWTDTPRATVPELCLTNTPPGSCDFSAAP